MLQTPLSGDSLFNGKDLTGWKQVGPGTHYVENGLIKSTGGMGLLYWKGEKFQNCILRVVFAMRDSNSNSGVFIRIPIEPREEWMPVHYGYEVQIDNAPEKSQMKMNIIIPECCIHLQNPWLKQVNPDLNGIPWKLLWMVQGQLSI